MGGLFEDKKIGGVFRSVSQCALAHVGDISKSTIRASAMKIRTNFYAQSGEVINLPMPAAGSGLRRRWEIGPAEWFFFCGFVSSKLLPMRLICHSPTPALWITNCLATPRRIIVICTDVHELIPLHRDL